MTEHHLVRARRNLTDQHLIRKRNTVGNADSNSSALWLATGIVGALISFLVVDSLAGRQLFQNLLTDGSIIFSDTAAVSTVFDTMEECEKRAVEGLNQASRQIPLKIDHIKPGIFYASAKNATAVIRCFPLENGHHHIFIASSGYDRGSVDAAMAVLYPRIAFR